MINVIFALQIIIMLRSPESSLTADTQIWGDKNKLVNKEQTQLLVTVYM